MPDDDPSEIDTLLPEDRLLFEPTPSRRVGMGRDRGARLPVGVRHRAQYPLHPGRHAGPVGRALENRGLDAGVRDALGQVADEELAEELGTVDQLPGPPEPEEHRHVVIGVEAGRDDDVDLDLLRHLQDAGDVAAQAQHGQVDDRADAAGGDVVELLHRVVDAGSLVPPARVVRLHLVVENEDVLVHQRHAEFVGRDRAEDGLDGGAGRRRSTRPGAVTTRTAQ